MNFMRSAVLKFVNNWKLTAMLARALPELKTLLNIHSEITILGQAASTINLLISTRADYGA